MSPYFRSTYIIKRIHYGGPGGRASLQWSSHQWKRHSTSFHVSLQWPSRLTPVAVTPHSSAMVVTYHASGARLEPSCIFVDYPVPFSAWVCFVKTKLGIGFFVCCCLLLFLSRGMIQELTVRIEWPYFQNMALVESEIIRHTCISCFQIIDRMSSWII